MIISLSLTTGGIHPHATQVKKEYFIESDVDEALRLSACLAPYPLYVHTPPNVYNLEKWCTCIIITSSLQTSPGMTLEVTELTAVVLGNREINNINYLTRHAWVYTPHQICQQKYAWPTNGAAIQEEGEQLTLFGRCLRKEGWCWTL